jgi:oxygen-dependent protoporphyrinogen oxidase
MYDRVVVGGGFAGLASALRALEGGESVTVLERDTRFGGALAHENIADIDIDSGAEALSRIGDDSGDLFTDLGLSDLVERPSSRAPVIVTGSGTTPIPRGVMGIPADLAETVTGGAITEEASDRARVLDAAPLASDWRTRSVRESVSERLGKPFLQYLVAPVMSAIYGRSSLDCSFDELLPSYADAVEKTGSLVAGAHLVRGFSPGPGSAVVTLRGGLHTVIDRLLDRVRELGGELLPGTHVSSLAREGNVWRVHTPEGTYQAPHITMAGGPASSGILLGSLGGLAEDLRATAWTGTTIGLVLVEDPHLDSFPLGSGALIAADVDPIVRATTHTNAKWDWVQQRLKPHQHILRFSCDSQPLDSSAPISEAISNALRTAYQSDPRHIKDVRIIHWPHHLIGVTPGYRDRSARLRERGGEQGIDIVGAMVSGNGLLGILRDIDKERAL